MMKNNKQQQQQQHANRMMKNNKQQQQQQQHANRRVSSTSNTINRFCFNPSDFDSDEFEASAFVDTQLATTKSSLSTLKEDLQLYGETLSGELVDLLNRDYKDFISLSSNLVGVDTNINAVIEHIDKLLVDVNNVNTVVDNAVHAVETRLSKRRENQDAYICLHTLNEIVQTSKLVQNLLKFDPYISKRSSSDDLTVLDHVPDNIPSLSDAINTLLKSSSHNNEKRLLNRSIVLERICILLSRLNVKMDQVHEFKLVQGVREQYPEMQRQLEAQLKHLFIASIRKHNEKCFQTILRCYSHFNHKLAYEIVATEFVRPFVNDIINNERFSGLDASSSSLQSIYDDILDAIRSNCGELIHFANNLKKYYRNCVYIYDFDFLTYSIWPQIARSLINCGQYLFRVGIASVFHHHYLTSLSFLKDLEELCLSEESCVRLRSHPSYIDLKNRWNVAIYFQLRFQQIGSIFEKFIQRQQQQQPLLCSNDTSMKYDDDDDDDNEMKDVLESINWEKYRMKEAPKNLKFENSKLLLCLLMSCWHTSIYLNELDQKFMKLSIQLLKRYVSWLQQLVNDKASNLNVHTMIKHDVECVVNFTKTTLIDVIMDSTSSGTRESIMKIFQYVGDQMNALLPTIQQHVSTMIINECKVYLQEVKRIKNMYRMTGRAAPTEACPYVQRSLQPLIEKMKSFSNEWSTTFCHTIRDNVVNILASVYQTHASELLNEVSKTDSSLSTLKRLKKQEKKQENEAKDMSDSDKIRMQIRIDVHEFVHHYIIAVLNIDIKDNACIQELLKTVE